MNLHFKFSFESMFLTVIGFLVACGVIITWLLKPPATFDINTVVGTMFLGTGLIIGILGLQKMNTNTK